MLYDIVAIQSKYGADYTTRPGATTYGFNTTADLADRPVFHFTKDLSPELDFTKNPSPVFTIWDGGGWDTIDASGFADEQTINLTPGSFSSIGGMTGQHRGRVPLQH